MSRQTVNAIEREKHAPNLELAFKIAGLFGLSIESIFSPATGIATTALQSLVA